MKRLLVALCLIAVCIGGASSSRAQSASIEQNRMVEVPLEITVNAKNPYDPAQADVQVTLTAPDGTPRTVPAFYMQPYQNACTIADCPAETLSAAGSPGWKLRFTPDALGRWQYAVRWTDADGTHEQPPAVLEVAPSTRQGMISKAANGRYFQYAGSGAAYFPVGMNLNWSWSGGGGTLAYLRWLDELRDVGANYARLVIDVPWFIDLEAGPPLGDYTAAQQDAWRLDTILRAAEADGIALQLVVLWSAPFGTTVYPPVSIPKTPARPDTRLDWATHPYNLSKGGPVGTTAAAFFSNTQARALFKQRLRYLAARWGASPAIFAWELTDQADRSAAAPGALAEWLREMTDTLRAFDKGGGSGGHLVTAGLRDLKNAAVLSSAAFDFTITRVYQRRPVDPASDQVRLTLDTLKPLLAVSDKPRPTLLTEFSLNPWFEPTADDPTGVHVRESMWAAALSGAAGSAMSAWPDTYLIPQKIVPSFRALAAFAAAVPWASANLQPIETMLYNADASAYRPLRLTAFAQKLAGDKAPDMTFKVGADTVEPALESASSFLYPQKSSLHQALRLRLSVPLDTTLTISTKRMANRGAAAILTLTLNEQPLTRVTLNSNAEPLSLTFPLKMGEHTLTLDNVGVDSVQLDAVEIGAYIPLVRTLGLADRTAGVYAGWFQHRDYTWQTKQEPPPASYRLSIPEMPPGTYRVEFWDVQDGNIAGEETVTVNGNAPGSLEVMLLPVSQMLAVRATRLP